MLRGCFFLRRKAADEKKGLGQIARTYIMHFTTDGQSLECPAEFPDRE